jgi:hypothetical protein
VYTRAAQVVAPAVVAGQIVDAKASGGHNALVAVDPADVAGVNVQPTADVAAGVDEGAVVVGEGGAGGGEGDAEFEWGPSGIVYSSLGGQPTVRVCMAEAALAALVQRAVQEVCVCVCGLRAAIDVSNTSLCCSWWPWCSEQCKQCVWLGWLVD